MNSAAWKQLALILALALAVRLTVAACWQSRLDGRFGFGDSESYWTLGRAVAGGQPYRYGSDDAEVFRTPGYPVILAPIFLLGGNEPPVMWARVESAVLGTLAVLCVWWLGRMLFDERTGLIAAAVAAFYPGAIAVGVLVLSESPFCVLMLVQLALWTLALRASEVGVAGAKRSDAPEPLGHRLWLCRQPPGRNALLLAVAAGLAAGAATLVRPSWLLFTPMAVLISVVVCGQKLRHLRIGAAVLLGLIVAMTPWWVRNAQVTSRFVPTTLQVGASLYDGLNPAATGASDMDFVDRFAEKVRSQSDESQEQPSEPFEVRLDRRLRTEAIHWAMSNPTRAAKLAAVKVMRTWNIWPNEPSLSAWPVRLAVALTYTPILILGILGAAGTIRLGWPYILCWLPAVYFTMLHAVFIGSIRYRQPAMLGLIVLAAGVVGGMGKITFSRRACTARNGKEKREKRREMRDESKSPRTACGGTDH